MGARRVHAIFLSPLLPLHLSLSGFPFPMSSSDPILLDENKETSSVSITDWFFTLFYDLTHEALEDV